MEEKETIVIDIQLDAKGVADQLAQVNKNIADVKAQNASLRKEVKDGTKTWRDVSEQLAVNEQRLKTLTTTQKVLTSQYNAQVGTNKRLGDSLKEMGSELTALKNEYRSLSAAERESAKGQELLKHIQDLDAAMKEADYTMGDHQRNVGNYPDAVKPVTAQLKEMTQALIQLRMEGKANTEEYNELLKKTGEMKDAMMDAQAEVKQMASDTGTLNSVLDGAKAAAGAFSVALGIMNLVGDKDSETAKELAEAQRKLQAAIAITTGLQAVQNALQKESALMMGVAKLRILAATAAQKLYAAATRDAAAAQTVFNKVAKSNIYVWLASVILSVVGAIAAFTGGSKDQREELEKVNFELKRQSEYLRQLDEMYSALGEKAIKDAQYQLDLAKASGKSTEEIRKYEDKLFNARLANLEKLEEELGYSREEHNRLQWEYEHQLQKYEDGVRRMAENAGKVPEIVTQISQDALDEQKKHLDETKGILDQFDKLYEERKNLQIERAEREAQRRREDEENARKVQEAARKRAEELKREREEIKRNREELKKANEELLEYVDQLKEGLAPTGEGDFFDKLKEKYEAVDKAAREAQERHELLRRFILETKGMDIDAKLDDSIMEKLERESNPLYNFAMSYKENAQAIQETSSALESSFGSLSSMYQQMAQDESKTEEERADAARKAKAWAKVQIATNAATAVAKGVASAVDVGFPAAIPAIATMLAAILSAIAQAKALASEAGSFEHGGVIGGYRGATMGKDNTFASVRTGEMIINADQQKRLYDIANGSATTNLTASLVEALQAMPAPVMVYSEFRRFTDRVATLDDAAKLH